MMEKVRFSVQTGEVHFLRDGKKGVKVREVLAEGKGLKRQRVSG